MALQGTKLALHSPFTHADARDWEVVKAWQPRSAKLFDDSYGSTDRINWLYGNLTDTLMVMRDHPLSEQKEDMYRNPVATGQRHAEDWRKWRDEGKFGKQAWKDIAKFDNDQTIVLGVNEPSSMESAPLNSSHPNYENNVKAVVDYTVAFLDKLKSFGMRGGALNLSVGFPDNRGTNKRPQWELWEPVYDAIRRGHHYLVCHEYWDIDGVMPWAQWWFDRLGMCPWDVPIIVGETGVDRGVNWRWKRGDSPRGYGGNINQEQYIEQLQVADMRYKGDKRVHSAQIYTYDFHNPEWASFSLRDMREVFLNYVNRVQNVQDTNALVFPRYPLGIANPLPPTGGQVPPPTVPNMTTRFIELARAEFGSLLEDLRASLPKKRDAQGNVIPFNPIDSRTMPYICFHHSATPINTTWLRVAEHHVNTNGWNAIGYALGVRLGKLALLGDLDTIRAHVLGKNHLALGTCIMGNYDSVPLSAENLDIMKRLVKVLDELYTTDKTLTDHNTLLGGSYTSCPGSAIILTFLFTEY